MNTLTKVVWRPDILLGEVVYCTTTGEIKVGDGVHKWADLPTAARRES